MGSCIICGTSVEGHICETHQQDVVFEFRGTNADQLTPGRFYRGTVDGYAEFGVFVDIADRVTGLLHRSELEQRLESLEWEPGDTVFVQVKNVRDNGNIDLGWSIRQSEREFRGTLIDDPEEDSALLKENVEDDEGGDDDGPVRHTVGQVPDKSERDDTRETGQTGAPATEDSESEETETEAATETADAGGSGGGAVVETEPQTDGEQSAVELTQVAVATLEDRVGNDVRIEGEIVDIRQTSGPTVFELRDETGVVDCAAFEEAGVRAYPEVEEGDLVRLDGEVRRRRGELQMETEALVVLEDDEHAAVSERMADALTEQARPEDVEPLAEDPAVDAVIDGVREAATAIRRAVLEDRPVVVRHNATVDGYVGGVAIERATLPLVRDQHGAADAEYHYFDRRPLEDGVYDMQDATQDVTGMLDNRERHDEKLPLFVFVAAGATRESMDGFDLLSVYDADRVVLDSAEADPEVGDTVDTLVSPSLTDAEDATTATAIAATVAAHVDEDVRAEIGHLPAVSFWEDAPESYVDLAAETGYDEDDTREIREAIALEAYYQSYEDKRELIADLLFPETDDERGLAGHVSEQFRTKMDAEIETAEANLEHRDVGKLDVAVLDTDAFAHRYEFPPTNLLLDELFRRHRDDVDVVVGLASDELYLRSTSALDVRAVAATAAEDAPDAGLHAKSTRDGCLEFLSGERDAVLDAVLDAVADVA
ncbi:DHH family phosphoesterase [Halorientalis regularis]|jgi:RecJ-like exonuclease|uniref:RecJ-like exonuclease, contains DnaJ-type Zn finger domain n=1 Tax=Halorientalis regularis TaxID=660518 RepID=A0A1G7NPA7_9EURY|nr:exodeoxyribonuclease VII large subunit [Halorientalis regularis]SDF75925.1 RecJ-like exonuclease, contains DnaJ-type Zn finger domain [Halorientalis regularis]